MLVLMTAALAAAQPAPAMPAADSHTHQMRGGDHRKHEQMKCCDCCKGMASKHEGHAEHHRHAD